MASSTKALRSSIIDGIAAVPRYRERQLASLHRHLSQAKAKLVETRTDGSDLTRNESTAEYLQTLHAISSVHSTCDPVASNEAEYTIARSEDYQNRRAAFGYAYIIPASESLYDIVVPLAAAIGSGNVVLLQRSPSTNDTTRLIETLLLEALSGETFAFVDRDPFDPKFQQSRGVILEGQSSTNAMSSSRRLCCPARRVAAVVDRSGDMKQAAKDLVQARFSFSGSSLYAPDIVLVNEFKVREFSEAVAEAGLRYLSHIANGSTNGKTIKAASSAKDSNTEDQGTTLMSGSRGKVVLLKSKDSLALSQKTRLATLFVLPVSSMDDAIDLLGKDEVTLAANYVFAAPAAAKYVTQFVKAAASFVNHVPSELLIGGLGPDGWQLSIHPRYTPEMFSQPAPTVITPSSRSSIIQSFVTLSGGKEQKVLEASLDAKMKTFKEPFGPMFGFFEQGFLFNAGFILTSIAIGTFCGIKYGYPAIASRW